MPGLRLRNPKDKGDNGTEILGPLRVWGHPTRPLQTPEVLLSAAEQDTGREVLEDIQHPPPFLPGQQPVTEEVAGVWQMQISHP